MGRNKTSAQAALPWSPLANSLYLCILAGRFVVPIRSVGKESPGNRERHPS